MKTTVTVDEVSWLVLPKNIRETIGVSGRRAVTVEVVGHATRITAPEPSRGAVSRTRGLSAPFHEEARQLEAELPHSPCQRALRT